MGFRLEDFSSLEYERSGSVCKASWKSCSDLVLVPKGHFVQENCSFGDSLSKTQAFVLTCTVRSWGTVNAFPQVGQLKSKIKWQSAKCLFRISYLTARSGCFSLKCVFMAKNPGSISLQ